MVLVVGGIAVPVTIASMTAPTAAFALEEVGRVPLQATVRLTDVSWGTRIDMDCRYPDGYAGNVPVGGWTYALAVVDAAGDATTVSTWRAEPGTRARVSAGTATAVSGIRAIEIRSAAGAVLMRRDLPARSG
ncbi:hypothetical protein [Microbacterium elymi]|uniref:Uncharacterized protein n=1 Tax=Microbacterium elymi TaxID=2909587 RepID=A0ABY5NK71_9MICO|nr:hypothetical protein [Microbacterium elymi]UUT35568.1 hypothetical protein L2X98_19790 [Microbacterium elymi]